MNFLSTKLLSCLSTLMFLCFGVSLLLDHGLRPGFGVLLLKLSAALKLVCL